MQARASRRDRAFRSGPVLFLHNRAYDEIIDRMGDIKHRFSSALLIGAADRQWADRVAEIAGSVTVIDPGAAFARASDGIQAIEDQLELEPGSFGLCIAIGTLDTVNDLPQALLRIRFLLKPDSLLIGAMSGGNTLPRLRQAIRAADAVTGAASPHVHPRVEPSALAQLLSDAGFAMPVVDVERVTAAYRSFGRLVEDLRGMGATNILTARPRRPLTRAALAAAELEFESGAVDGRTVETFELLHFAAWTPAEDRQVSDS